MHILQLCWDALLLLDKLNFKMSPNLFAMVLCVGDRSYVAQRQRSDAEDNGRPKKRIKMASVVVTDAILIRSLGLPLSSASLRCLCATYDRTPKHNTIAKRCGDILKLYCR